MADLNDLLIRIDATTEQLRREMKKAEQITDNSTRKMDRSLEQIDKRMGALAKRAAVAGAAMTAAFATAGAIKLVRIARETDILDAQLKTATGSAEAAARAFAELEDFAANTPFALQETIDAFVRLTNLGLDPSRAALESYGNTASAMGKSLEQFIEAVADAATAEFERLKEFGIRAKNQGDTIAFTFRGVTETVRNNAREIEGYLRRIGETEFAGAMEERVNSLDGALSNLSDSWDSLFRSVARGPIGDLIEEYVRKATAAIERLDRMLSQLTGTASPLVMLQNQLDDLYVRRQNFEKMLASPLAGKTFLSQVSEELETVKAQIQGTHEAMRYFKDQAASDAANKSRPVPGINPSVTFSTLSGSAPKSGEVFDPSMMLLQGESSRIQSALSEVDQFFASTMTETEQLEKQIARVQELAGQGFFALRGVDDKEILERLNQQLEEVESKSSVVADILQSNLGGAIDDMFTSGKLSAEDFFESMLRDIARVATQLYIMQPLLNSLFGGGGVSGGGLAGSIGKGIGALFAARGADFTVGGSGGPDSQFIPMMLSPRERVKITPPGQSSGEVQINVIDQRGAGAPPIDVSEQLVGMQRSFQVLVRGEVAGMYRDGSIDRLNRVSGFPVIRRGSR